MFGFDNIKIINDIHNMIFEKSGFHCISINFVNIRDKWCLPSVNYVLETKDAALERCFQRTVHHFVETNNFLKPSK